MMKPDDKQQPSQQPTEPEENPQVTGAQENQQPDQKPTEAEDELFQYGQTEKKKRVQKMRTGLLRKFIPAIVLGCAAVVLVGVYVMLRLIAPNEGDAKEQVNTMAITELTAGDVRSVYVINNNDEYRIRKKAGSVYEIEGKEDKEVSSSYISSAISTLSEISATRKVDVLPEKLADYGLETPQARAEIESRTETVTLYLGNQAADENYYYMLKLDDERNTDGRVAVYLVNTTVADLIRQTRLYYYEQDISGYDPNADASNISPIIISGKKATPVSVRSAQGDDENEDDTVNVDLSFMIYEPISMPFSTSAMSSLLSLLTTLNTAEAVSDDVRAESLASYGLDDPDYVLHFGNNTFERTILFGKTDGDFIFCMQEGGGVIYTIDKDAIACMKLSLADMCDAITYTRDVDTVTGIRVSDNAGRTFNMRLLGKDDTLRVFVNEREVPKSNFSEFYSALLGIEVSKEGEKPAGDPYITLELTLTDGSTETLRYYIVDERYCYYELNGTGMFYVAREAADMLMTNAQRLYDNEEIALPW